MKDRQIRKKNEIKKKRAREQERQGEKKEIKKERKNGESIACTMEQAYEKYI